MDSGLRYPTLATASDDTSVILWHLDLDKFLLDKDLDQLMTEACSVVRDYLNNKPKEDSNRRLCDGLGTPM
jgi:hypothetical protein